MAEQTKLSQNLLAIERRAALFAFGKQSFELAFIELIFRVELLARREQSLRVEEADGRELVADGSRGGELFMLSDADLQAVIEGRDAA